MKKIFVLSIMLAFIFNGSKAQEVIMSGEALYNSNFGIINSSIMGNYGSKKKTTTAKKATKANLVFKRNESLSKKIQENFMAQLVKTQPEQKEQLQKVFAQNKLRTQFDNLLSGYGYASTNLADAMTAWLVINWQVVHGKEFNDKKGFDAVRNMITKTLVGSHHLAAATNAEKQTLAETFGYQAIMAMQAYKATAAGAVGDLPALQDAIYKNTKAGGIDLKKYNLTANGFVQK